MRPHPLHSQLLPHCPRSQQRDNIVGVQRLSMSGWLVEKVLPPLSLNFILRKFIFLFQIMLHSVIVFECIQTYFFVVIRTESANKFAGAFSSLWPGEEERRRVFSLVSLLQLRVWLDFAFTVKNAHSKVNTLSNKGVARRGGGAPNRILLCTAKD